MAHNQDKKKIILGITGTLGSGKSTVARFFLRRGVKVVDADKIAHALIRPGTPAYQRVIQKFGQGIIRKDKTIDRARLARIVFSDKKQLSRLNAIMHPAIIRIIKDELSSSPQRLIVLDAPLLIEAGLRGIADKIVVVKASLEKRIARLRHKKHLNKTEVLKRMKYQMAQGKKARWADFIIDNNGSILKTRRQVGIIRRLLWRN
ncbi:MAG: dephospho-CoA kinase [Candidatus Omnitrophota bacterium]